MDQTTGLLILSCVIASLVVAALWKGKKTPMSGFIVKGKDGRIGISLSPIKKAKKRRPKRRK